MDFCEQLASAPTEARLTGWTKSTWLPSILRRPSRPGGSEPNDYLADGIFGMDGYRSGASPKGLARNLAIGRELEIKSRRT